MILAATTSTPPAKDLFITSVNIMEKPLTL